MQMPVTTLGQPEAIETLIQSGPLKAWSVIVTILGDLCESPQDRVSGKQLNELMGAIGISDQTVRVALHRLRRDGWVDSEKRGRGAEYALTQSGWEETQQVKDRIYAPDGPETRPIYLAISPPDLSAAEFTERLPERAVSLGRRTAVIDSPLRNSDEFLITSLTDSPLPNWLRASIAGPKLCEDYDQLTQAAEQALAVAQPGDLSLRLLTLHHWRRLQLRHGDLPDLLLGPDWAGAKARRVVMALLDAVPRPDL